MLGVLPAGAESKDPNILLIVVDTLRADHVGAYGYFRNTTPNIDTLASRGVLFENAISQAPWSLPSHASLFTSLNPNEHGSASLNEANFSETIGIRQNLTTLAEVLKQNGYATAAFVDSPFVAFKGFEKGFNEFHVTQPGSPDSEEVDLRGDAENVSINALAWLEKNRGKKFFLFVQYLAPHQPYSPPEGFREFINEDDYSKEFRSGGISAPKLMEMMKERCEICPAKNRSNGGPDYIVAHYDGEVKFADFNIGTLANWIYSNEIGNETAFFVLSDHGEELFDRGKFEHTYSLYDEVLRVPLVMSGPNVPKNVRIKSQVRLIDVAPTVLEIAGVGIPRQFKGQSLLPLANGKTNKTGVAYSETQTPSKRYSLRTNELKIIKNSATDENGEYEYYDLASDPLEQINLATIYPAFFSKLTPKEFEADSPRAASIVIENAEPNGRIDREASQQETGEFAKTIFFTALALMAILLMARIALKQSVAKEKKTTRG